MSDVSNPRALPGGNQPDYALEEVARLEVDFQTQADHAEALLLEARSLPVEIPDDTVKGQFTSLIKRIRDHSKLLETYHATEKQPWLRRGQGVDQFFFGLVDKLQRRAPKAKPGAADILLARLTAYDQKKLEEERARLRREAEEAERVARVAREKAAAEALAAEQARLAAERARKPETKAAKDAVAEVTDQQASASFAQAQAAAAQAEDAFMAERTSTADLMRTRGIDGTLSTMQEEPYAEVVDRMLLDKNLLWPFLKAEAIESALKAYAKTTDFKVSMPGAAIGRRPKSRVR